MQTNSTSRVTNDSLNEYRISGSYHVDGRMGRNWLPRYYRRLHITVETLRTNISREARIVDIGGGEGILVDKLLASGFNYSFGVEPYAQFINDRMVRGTIFKLPIRNNFIDAVTCLDVLEHLPLNRQDEAANELVRVLRAGGIAIVSVPNMAHLRSRLQFLLTGKPWRNDLLKHPGELSIYERIELLQKAGLVCHDRLGLHLTITYNPNTQSAFGRLLGKIMFYPNAFSGLCWTVLLLLYKPPRPSWITNTSKARPLLTSYRTYSPPREDPTSEFS